MYELDINSIDSLTLVSVGTDSRKYITRIMKLKNLYPEEVIIKRTPLDNDGYILAYVPKEWIHIAPKRKVEMSDEKRKAIGERLSKVRNVQQ